LSSKLGTSVDKTAENILRIVNSNMSKALSLVSLERGRDPREYTLITFGGSGPVHACDLAEELGIRRIVVPLHPGLFSAFGLLTAELSRTFTQPIRATENVERTFAQLREQARKSLKEEGFTTYQTIEQVDLRYQGQAYEITVPYEKEANLTKLFGREHKKLYGYLSLDAVEAVNARVRVIIPNPKANFVKKRLQASKSAAPILSRRMSLIGSWQKVPVYDRMRLLPGVSGKGPCIIEEYDSTTVVGKNWAWMVGPYDEIDVTTRLSRRL
jgi:N-methylhydantoinase A